MSVGSSRKRAMRKAQGMTLRRGPEKGTTGKAKGPARSPSLAEVRGAARRQERRALPAGSALAAKGGVTICPDGSVLDTSRLPAEVA